MNKTLHSDIIHLDSELKPGNMIAFQVTEFKEGGEQNIGAVGHLIVTLIPKEKIYQVIIDDYKGESIRALLTVVEVNPITIINGEGTFKYRVLGVVDAYDDECYKKLYKALREDFPTVKNLFFMILEIRETNLMELIEEKKLAETISNK